jgi:hypothetical protein
MNFINLRTNGMEGIEYFPIINPANTLSVGIIPMRFIVPLHIGFKHFVSKLISSGNISLRKTMQIPTHF